MYYSFLGAAKQVYSQGLIPVEPVSSSLALEAGQLSCLVPTTVLDGKECCRIADLQSLMEDPSPLSEDLRVKLKKFLIVTALADPIKSRERLLILALWIDNPATPRMLRDLLEFYFEVEVS